MGCTTSQPKNDPPKGLKGKKKSKKALDSVENTEDISDSDLHKMKEEMLQRHDTEIDILTQLSAERLALRQMAAIRIDRKLSCEELRESLSNEEWLSLRESPQYQQLQKQYKLKLMKKSLINETKSWQIYNNLEALNDAEISVVGVFLINLLYTLRVKKKTVFHHNKLDLNGASHSDDGGNKVRPPNPPRAVTETIEFGTSVDLEEKIRHLSVVTMALDSHYDVQQLGSFDYELPPGLVTIQEVKSIIEVYRRGGKLVTRSVQKLLRLGYQHFSKQQNISRVSIGEEEKLIIVGDIHGQLADLLHILDNAGLPSANTKYIFNGDFVDRGEWGVEVMCILLAMIAAYPDKVYLNRGNHEDYAICSVYGFQVECYDKYDPLTFGMFVEIFQHIPLFAVVNESVFVVHGGLFHTTDATLDELNDIRRQDFSLEDMPEHGEEFDAVPRTNKVNFLKQLVRDALWSDPIDSKGVHPSVRGAGVGFGPDVTKRFLTVNNLKFVIRSHECVRSGYDEPYASEEIPLLCTIFSASDYGGSGNSAAYLEFRVMRPEHNEVSSPLGGRSEKANSIRRRSLSHIPAEQQGKCSNSTGDNVSSMKLICGTELGYDVHYFYATPLKFSSTGGNSASFAQVHHDGKAYDLTSFESGGNSGNHSDGNNDDDSENASEKSKNLFLSHKIIPPSITANRNLLIGSNVKIEELIWSRKALLLETFDQQAQKDRTNSEDVVPYKEFVRILSEILNISLSWRKAAMLLLREEDKVHPTEDALDALDSSSSSAGKSSAWKGRSAPEQGLNSNFSVRYKSFLSRYDDEITAFVKRKEEEASKASMDALQRYLDSLDKGETKSSDVVSSAGEKERLTVDGTNTSSGTDGTINITVDDHLSSTELNLTSKHNPNCFHGHLISEDLIRNLYVNYHQLEQAFQYFDADKDGYFNLQDLQRVCHELELVDPTNNTLLHVSSGMGPVDERVIMSIMDVHQCGEIDINVFFEICRLGVLNSLHPDDAASRPQMAREFSFNQDIHRLSHAMSSASLAPSSSKSSHQPTQTTLTSVELKKGVEIGVDAELTPARITDSVQENVGLSIDI